MIHWTRWQQFQQALSLWQWGGLDCRADVVCFCGFVETCGARVPGSLHHRVLLVKGLAVGLLAVFDALPRAASVCGRGMPT